MRLIILKIFLRLSALFQILYWSLSHIFFPKWYLNSIGVTNLDIHKGFALLTMNKIGILTFGIAIATFWAASDPIKNFAIIIMIYIISIGSILVSAYHLIMKSFTGYECLTIIIIFIQLFLITILYPWQKLRIKS